MVAKCSNLSCSASFLHLKDGRLFRLESDPGFHSPRPVEYFWLCQSCASKMTLRLTEDGKVTTAPIPESMGDVPDGVELISADRKTGLLLRSVRSPLSEHLRGHNVGGTRRLH